MNKLQWTHLWQSVNVIQVYVNDLKVSKVRKDEILKEVKVIKLLVQNEMGQME